MSINSNKAGALALAAALAVTAPTALAAQDQGDTDDVLTTVYGTVPTEGPEIEGVISARNGDMIQVTGEDGRAHMITILDETEIKAKGGFLGLGRTKLGTEALLNGLPVAVETLQADGKLFADEIRFSSKDLEMATMIRNGTNQRFSQNEAAIEENTVGVAENAAATEALRGRFGDIDKYNIKGTTNVYFDTGKYNLSASARAELCEAAEQAESMDNALLLVVGYTDSTGSYEVNQALSEKRAGRVVNFLQQECGWKPWRMLSPTGMAAADPAADNSTPYGKAQNRRVAVNVLVSKSVDGM
ncbi:OmpA family protein [Erythrobacter sp. GH1-10]|uniref:OmpA family protein n=1 Tax=Erythrobacter sp. GH1-10 TaxID=3349334 RepID=UPI003877FB81